MTPALAFLLLGTLYDQSIAKLLDRRFTDPAVSYVLLDAADGTVIAQRWQHPESAVPAGSLVKPFLALAASSNGQFPVLSCNPKHCWHPKGHGTVDITKAIANSCNSYFLQLAPHANADFLSRFGLTPPPHGASVQTWIGLGREWKLSPLALARAYSMVARDPQSELIRSGMLQSSQSGTGRAIAMKALIKTGTAACAHPAGQPGDGYAVVLYPPEAPKYTLLVQIHGVPGATAAVTAGKMLRAVLDGK
jgi:cell division protein FtsI/penicillin-binding protein 2